jgi:hypothetical protein
MAVTIVSLLSAFVEECCPTTRGEGIKRSDIVEHVALPMVRAVWFGEGLPGPRTPLTNKTSDQVRAAMPDRTTLAKRVATCRILIQRVMRMVESSGLAAAPSDFSEWVAIRVGRGESDVEALAELAFERRRRLAEALGRDEFVAGYGADYDLRWGQRGAASRLSWPPADLHLGSNEKPAITTHTFERWSVGCDRSVHGRYMLGFRASSASRTQRRCPDPTCGRTMHPVGDSGMNEIERVCSPYGLEKTTHHVVLRSLEKGYLFGLHMTRPTTGTTWAAWVGECGDVAEEGEVDPDIVDAVAHAVAAFAASYVADTLRSKYNDVDVLASTAALAAFMRRAWMELHRREREHTMPVRRCWVSGIVAAALSSGIGLGLSEFLTSGHEWLTIAPQLIGAPNARGDDHHSFQAVCDVLIDHQRLVRSILADEPGWADQYDFVMGQAGLLGRHHPGAREFAAWLFERVGERG